MLKRVLKADVTCGADKRVGGKTLATRTGCGSRAVANQNETRCLIDCKAVEGLWINLKGDITLANQPLDPQDRLLERTIDESAEDKRSLRTCCLIDQALERRLRHREAHEDEYARAGGVA